MVSQEGAKQAAAHAAVAFVEDGMLLGLGSGTTAAYFIAELGVRVRDGLRVAGVPTSNRTRDLATAAGIPLTQLHGGLRLDLDVDGTDEVDPKLNLIKGGGGALLHEKLVALASNRLIVIADATKMVDHLGGRRLPVEVVEFAWESTFERVKAMGGHPTIRGEVRSPMLTDSGNVIFDVTVPSELDIFEFSDRLKATTGVVDHGLFRDLVETALIGRNDGTVEVRRRPSN